MHRVSEPELPGRVDLRAKPTEHFDDELLSEVTKYEDAFEYNEAMLLATME